MDKKTKKSTDCVRAVSTAVSTNFYSLDFLSEAVSWGDRDRKLEKNAVVSTEHVQPYERVRKIYILYLENTKQNVPHFPKFFFLN